MSILKNNGNLGVRIIAIVFGSLFLINILVIGYSSDIVIKQVKPSGDILEEFCRLLYYYMIIDLVIRYIFQKINLSNFYSYLSLPIKKKSLFNFYLIGSLISFINLIPISLTLPFFIKVIVVTYDPLFAITWIILVASIFTINHYVIILARFYFFKNNFLLVFLIIQLLSFAFWDTYIDIPTLFSQNIIKLSSKTILAIIPLTLVIIIYSSCFYFLKSKGRYIDYFLDDKTYMKYNLNFINGVINNLILLELTLIWRNIRPRSSIIMALFFMCYGIILYNSSLVINNSLFLLGAGILITGLLALQYGQYLISWESEYFDLILTSPISFYTYLKSKFFLISSLSSVGFILTLPYVFFDEKILYYNLAALLCNVSITPLVLLFSSLFNTKSISLNKGIFFNYEGMGFNQFIVMIGVLLIPILIIWLSNQLIDTNSSLTLLMIICLIFFLTKNYFIELMARQLDRRKYIISQNFRVD